VKNASVLTRALVFGGVLAVGLAVLGALVGYLVAGPSGLVSALLGTSLTAVFMGFSTLSVFTADRISKRRGSNAGYFGIVLGMSLLKFPVFIAVLLLVRGQAWLNPYIFFFALVAAVIGSLVVDIVALAGARVPYVGDIDLSSPSQPAQAPTGPEN
jgi:hypothetical protein